MIAQDIQARLSTLGVPVLSPEQIETPNAGAGKGQKTGIPGYLERTAPGGYVQIENALTISTDDYVARYWVPVAVIAPDYTACQTLSEQVRRALCGTPPEPGPYSRALADRPRLVSGGFYLCRPTYDIPEIDGVIAV